MSETIERYNWLERWTHTFHAIAMLVLIFTGLVIYFRWDILTMHNARIYHMIAVPALILTNWLLVPYGIFSHGMEEGGLKGVAGHFYHAYIFNKDDAKVLAAAIKNFFNFGKTKYPAFTIYNETTGHYRTKLHPMFKLFIVVEGCCIFLVFITGIVLYNVDWSIIGIPVAHIITTVFGWIAPVLNLTPLAFVRWVHLLMTYFFMFELICHALILEFDPKVFRYWKAIFINGKEEIDGPVVEVIHGEHE
ncbi:MAG: cytochrome B [Methanosarcinaceae archaeon]|nr:cytochrome B [Methanosarcinaceae archaeon]